MEPHNDELTKTPERSKNAKESRFQIMKLEERIAPNKGGVPNGGGGGNSGCHLDPICH